MGGLRYTSGAPSGDTIETYFRPIVETPLKKAQMEQYAISMENESMVAIRESCVVGEPARMFGG